MSGRNRTFALPAGAQDEEMQKSVNSSAGLRHFTTFVQTNTMQTLLFATIIFCATAHLMMCTVLALYSRYKVQYLSLAWIMGIFFASFCAAIPFSLRYEVGTVGLLHPVMLLVLVTITYLQSIYPLGISLPGYLQWGRMWGYASPAIAIIVLYVLGLLMGSRPIIITHLSDLPRNLLSSDMLLRLTALGLSTYYIVNIFRLPHILVKNYALPRYLKGYGTAIGIACIYYVVVTVVFNMTLLIIYMYVFTVLNMYMFYRTLETMAMHLPRPVIRSVEAPPTTELIEKVEQESFNEANIKRFERVEYFMQTEQEWKDNTFGRDRLCEATGINRHLLLQCLRSQGYNNCHDYISSYRLNALKKAISRGRISDVNECVDMGFGSAKTARSCFQRMEGMSLDDYIKEHHARPEISD